jgi:ribosomal protein S18 acetylase RimI-like enzyme
MPEIRFEPFSEAHLDDAAELLARRHRRHLDAEPLLAQHPDFRAELAQELAKDGASGLVVHERASLRGYLIAAPRQFTNSGLDWMLVDVAGHALEGDPELLRDLYGRAAQGWVESGHTRHGVYVPASETGLIDAWFRLMFGASAITAARETAAESYDAPVEVRDGGPEDLEATARLDEDMAASMRPGPSFSGMEAMSDEERIEDWRDTWDDPLFKHFVAERDGRVVGHLLLYTGRSGLRVPEGSIDLAAASTEPAARGSGAGRALTAHALTWAHENGYAAMTTDWRMTNLLASRFWPKRGFRPTFLRMYRSIP